MKGEGLRSWGRGENLDQWWEDVLATMPAWTERVIPPDLSFTVEMRRRVLSRAPGVLRQESQKKARLVWRWIAVAASVLLFSAGVLAQARWQVPGVVELAAAPSSSAEGVGKREARRVQMISVLPAPALEPAPGEAVTAAGEAVTPAVAAAPPPPAAGAGEIRGAAVMAGFSGVKEASEGRLRDRVAFAGGVGGQGVVVTASGDLWRYVDGSLVGGESLPVARKAGARSLILLPGKEKPVAVWVDQEGNLRWGEAGVGLDLPTHVLHLALVASPGGSGELLAAGSSRHQEGYRLGLWLLSWQGEGLKLEQESPALYQGKADPALLDLAAYRGERGITMYVTLRAGEQRRFYLAEWRGSRLRWEELPGPLFQPGTAVASAAGQLAGVHPRGGVALVEWRPNSGVAAWLRPGTYALRQISFPELAEGLRSVFFFSPAGEGREGLLLVSTGGEVGYVDASLLSSR